MLHTETEVDFRDDDFVVEEFAYEYSKLNDGSFGLVVDGTDVTGEDVKLMFSLESLRDIIRELQEREDAITRMSGV